MFIYLINFVILIHTTSFYAMKDLMHMLETRIKSYLNCIASSHGENFSFLFMNIHKHGRII